MGTLHTRRCILSEEALQDDVLKDKRINGC